MKRAGSVWVCAAMLSLVWGVREAVGQDIPVKTRRSPELRIEFDDELPRQRAPSAGTDRTGEVVDGVTDEEASGGEGGASRQSATSSPLSELDWEAVLAPMPAAERQVEDNRTDLVTPVTRDPHLGTSDRLTFPWASRGLAHRTLYFEDMPLERYGQTCGDHAQALKSGVRFLADAITTPLQMLYECPCDLHYVLGLDRPGACSCPQKQCIVPYVPKY